MISDSPFPALPFSFGIIRTIESAKMKREAERAIGNAGEREERTPPRSVESPAPRDQDKLKEPVALAKATPLSPSVIQSSIFGHRKLIATPYRASMRYRMAVLSVRIMKVSVKAIPRKAINALAFLLRCANSGEKARQERKYVTVYMLEAIPI